MMSNYLNLNNRKIRRSVISKLNSLGYKLDKSSSIRQIEEIIKTIQLNNGKKADGRIGGATIGLLYSYDEMMELFYSDYPTFY